LADSVITPAFALNNLVATLEDLLERARAGELSSCLIVAVDKSGDYTMGCHAGQTEKMPIMTLIGELEYQKQILLAEVQD
jgi:hypothetical protein